jgi:hypothetical protein
VRACVRMGDREHAFATAAGYDAAEGVGQAAASYEPGCHPHRIAGQDWLPLW